MISKKKDSNESKTNFLNIFENQRICQIDFPSHLIAKLFSSPHKEENILKNSTIDTKKEDKDDTKDIFKVIYPKKVSLFSDDNYSERDLQNGKYNFKKRIKSKKKLERYKCRDNIRKMIKRRFFNTYLKNALNAKLKKAGYNLFFECFPQCLAGNVIKNQEKTLLNMKLRQFFENKELYEQNNNLTNYFHNLKVLEKIKKDKNQELEAIFEKKYLELFKEYLNSKEFKIEEINRLKNIVKKQKKDDYYIEKYKYLANHFIEFCQKK